jgi:protocatechuate 3,4-dioxygenase, beta subunit
MTSITGYRRLYFETQPAYLCPRYRSTLKRSPARPLVLLPHTLTEVTGPMFGYDDVKPTGYGGMEVAT